MPHYFPDRRKVRDLFWIPLKSKREKVSCAIYERWQFRKSVTCYCGAIGTVTYSKSKGVSETVSETLEHTIESSIGPVGIASVKAAIKQSISHQVNWSKTETEQASFPCNPPKCGRSETTIYELFREYELALYRRGWMPFRDEVWDRKWSYTVPEETGSYVGVPDTVEWDPLCRCETKASPEYDGRLSIDLGSLSLLVPYKQTTNGMDVRISNLVISFPFHDYKRALYGLEHGLNLPIRREFLPDALIFMGGLQGESWEANARVYKDEGTQLPVSLVDSQEIVAHPSVVDLATTLKLGIKSGMKRNIPKRGLKGTT